MQQKTIICNWKMTIPYTDAITFGKNHFQELSNLCADSIDLVICPSFESLAPLVSMTPYTHIHIGAQNCSVHEKGAYTSQVSSFSLATLGVTHCIIGHSETRAYLHETDAEIAQKLQLLFAQNITPIVCIGESFKAYKTGTAKSVLSKQLEQIVEIAQEHSNKKIYIAYEPIWAIGTGIIPNIEELEDTFIWLQKICGHAHLLYGGSVDETNSAQLQNIRTIDGFLIGGASTDFQKLKKIVLSVIEG